MNLLEKISRKLKSITQTQNRIFLAQKKFGLQDYQQILLLQFLSKSSFKDKIVLEIGSDLELNTAKAMLALGAKEVYAVNFSFPDDATDVPPQIHRIKAFGEESGLPDNCCDIIFGIALLEHVVRPFELVSECKRLMKPGAVGFLHGCPVWTCHNGNHIYINMPDGREYRFYNESSPFQDWEHLIYDNEEELARGLSDNHNFSSADAKHIAAWIYNDDILCRKAPSSIIKEAQAVKGIKIQTTRYGSTAKKNDFFSKALQKYSEEDLLTEGFEMWIEK